MLYIRLLKLEVLTSICTKDNIQSILQEFQIYIKHTNVDFVCATIRAIGRIADVDTSIASNCINGLMTLVLATCLSAQAINENKMKKPHSNYSSVYKNSTDQNHNNNSTTSLYYTNSLNTLISHAELPSDRIIEESVVVLRQLIQQNASTDKSDVAYKTLQKLMKMLIIDKEDPGLIYLIIIYARIISYYIVSIKIAHVLLLLLLIIIAIISIINLFHYNVTQLQVISVFINPKLEPPSYG